MINNALIIKLRLLKLQTFLKGGIIIFGSTFLKGGIIIFGSTFLKGGIMLKFQYHLTKDLVLVLPQVG